jgi:hypothetical protein
MKSNWKDIVTTLLAEHMGALAHVVLEDAMAKTLSPVESSGYAHELVLRLVQELPDGVNRAQIAAQLRDAIR